MSTHSLQVTLRRAARGGKPEQKVENSERQNNAYILATRVLNSTQTAIHQLIDCLTARQHRKINLCQLRGKETGSVS